jgi:hypothetical protein
LRAKALGLFLVTLAGAFATTRAPSLADSKPPYETKIACGEIVTAQIVFGEIASACSEGRDAVPAFSNEASYQAYYRFDADPSCDVKCLRPMYSQMKRAGVMYPLISGDKVIVLSSKTDPEDKHYRICRIKTARGRWIVACLALANFPD